MNKNKLTGLIFLLSATILTVLYSCKLAGKKTENNSKGSAVENNDGWKPLFDGKTTAGWHTYGADTIGSAWKAEDSTLHLDASQKNDWQTKGGGDIVTNDEFGNFDLQIDWKISEGGNSGIMFYVHEDTSKFQYAWNSGPEMQIADNDKNEDGKVYKCKAGDIYELFPTTSDKYVKPAMQWNHVEIKSNNGKLDLYMNDHQVLDTTIWDDAWKKSIAGTKFKDMPGFGTFKKGKIALQDHGADIWFRNIKIKDL
ncbi:MAG: 3-keto-disaccharide hydrolase [Ginsengibacter sp.]